MSKIKFSELSSIEKLYSLLILAGAFLHYVQREHIQNTIGVRSFYLLVILFGIISAALITLILKKLTPTIYESVRIKGAVAFGFFIGLTFLSLAGGIIINRTFADPTTTECNRYTILKKDRVGSKSRTSCVIYVDFEQSKNKKIIVDWTLYKDIQEGEGIEICTQKGRLGYRFFSEFNR